MKKEIFHKKWSYRILQIIFWSSLIFLIYISIWAMLYEDDMPFIGVIWIGLFVLAYWLVKKIFFIKNQKI